MGVRTITSARSGGGGWSDGRHGHGASSRTGSASTRWRPGGPGFTAEELTALLRGAVEAELPDTVVAALGERVAVPGLVEPLSARELQVLELIAAGHPNRVIAGQL